MKNIIMKNSFIYIFISIWLLSCNSGVNIGDNDIEKNEHVERLKTLNINNLEYFKIEYHSKYKYIPEYVKLRKIDSLVNILCRQITNNEVDTESINSLIYIMDKSLYRLDNNLKKHVISLVQNSFKTQQINKLLLAEYICGNELLKQYNYYLFRMPLSKVLVDSKDDTISLGETYQAKIHFTVNNPHRKFIVLVDQDTLEYTDNGIPIYSFQPKEKGNYKKSGRFLFYSEGKQKYLGENFEINIVVK